MKLWTRTFIGFSLLMFAGNSRVTADDATVGYALNAQAVSAGGSSQVFWGPIASRSTLSVSGSFLNFPQKFSGTTMTVGGVTHCAPPPPTQGPGTLVPPSSVPVYDWYCDYPVANPSIDFSSYSAIAQNQGNVCSGGPCYFSGSTGLSNTNDTTCTVGGQPKVWYFDGDVKFTGGTYFCGILIVNGSIDFAGHGNGNITVTPPADAWQQYTVATPNGTPGYGDTAAQDEYPGDGGFHTVKPFTFGTGGTENAVTFRGYVFAKNGINVTGSALILGTLQMTSGGSTNTGGATVYFEGQAVHTTSPTVATPTITPPGGTFGSPQLVSIQTITPGASIFYTLDGTTPNDASLVYTGPFMLSVNTTVKAIGHEVGFNDSAVGSAVFTFNNTPPPPPILNSLTPNTTTAGSPTFLLTLSGSQFLNGAAVLWNGSSRTSTFVNATQLQATILATDVQNAGLASVQVVNPDGQKSSSKIFTTTGVTSNTHADLSISKTANLSTVAVGNTVTYTLAVSNAGPDTAIDTLVDDYLPSELSFVSVTASQGSCTTSNPVKCSLGNLASGAGASVTLVAQARIANASVINTASVGSNTPDNTLGNNRSQVTIAITSGNSGNMNADVAIGMTASPTTLTIGDHVTYTLTASNAGADAATNVILLDNLPAELSPVSATADSGNCTISGNTIQCALGTMASGSNTTVTLIATAQTAGVNVTNTATIGSQTPDNNQRNNSVTSTIRINAGTFGNSILTSIKIVPAAAAIGTGGQLLLTGQGYDQNNNVMDNILFDWAVTGPNTISPNSQSPTTVFTAGNTVGTYTVAATSGTIQGTASITVETGNGNPTGGLSIIDPATASPNPVFGTTTQLHVLATSDNPGPISYTWTYDGLAPVIANNHAADTGVLFTQPGIYHFQVLMIDSQGLQLTSQVSVTVLDTVTKVTLNPSHASTFVGQSFNFTAQALDQFNKPMSVTLVWSASAGSISQTGSFISNIPLSNGVVKATAPNGIAGTASITVQTQGGLGNGVVSDISHAKAYPVPYKSTSGAPGITFTGLAPDTTIKIFTTDGHLVQTLTSVQGENVLWPVTNSGGRKVASWVYFGIIENATSGQVVKVKLVVIQ